jgi:hypothetical protein
MKTTLILTAALMGGIAFPTMTMADALPVFPGAAASGCDPEQFTPTFGANGDVLYWNNPTCPNGQGGMDDGTRAVTTPATVVEVPAADEPPVEDDEVAEDPADEPTEDLGKA